MSRGSWARGPGAVARWLLVLSIASCAGPPCAKYELESVPIEKMVCTRYDSHGTCMQQEVQTTLREVRRCVEYEAPPPPADAEADAP